MLPRWACRRLGGSHRAFPTGLHNSCHCLRQRLKHLPPHVCGQLLQASASSWLACMGCQACLMAWHSSGVATKSSCVHLSMGRCKLTACTSRCSGSRHLNLTTLRIAIAIRHAHQTRISPSSASMRSLHHHFPHLAATHPQPAHCCPAILCSACGPSALQTQALPPEHHLAEAYSW